MLPADLLANPTSYVYTTNITMLSRHMFDLIIVTMALVALGPIDIPVKALRVSPPPTPPRETYIQAGRQAGRQADRQTDRQTDRASRSRLSGDPSPHHHH